MVMRATRSGWVAAAAVLVAVGTFSTACGSESAHGGAGVGSDPVSTASNASSTPTSSPSAAASGLRPATAATLVGTWRSERPANAAQLASTVTLTIEADGRWTSSDGCRQRSGTWTIGQDGALQVSSTGAVATGCVTDAMSGGVGPWTTAARAAFDGHQLVLLAADGHELGRLVTTPPSHLMSHGPAPRR